MGVSNIFCEVDFWYNNDFESWIDYVGNVHLILIYLKWCLKMISTGYILILTFFFKVETWGY